MNVDIEPKPTREIIPTNVLQQTAFWARLKNKQGWGTHAFDLSLGKSEAFSGTRLRKHEREGDILITLRAIGGGRYMAYVPFGPEQLPDEERRGIWLEEISEQLRNFLPEDCLFIRYDLCWESPWAREEEYFSEDGMWLGPPDAYVQEMRMNFDTRNFNLRKAPSDMLPAHTVMLDLDKEEDALLSEMKSKTRYNIRLSQRKGVEVRRAGMDELDKWFRLYDETYTRNRLAANDLSFFEQVFQTRADDTKSPGEVDLLLAEKDGELMPECFWPVQEKGPPICMELPVVKTGIFRQVMPFSGELFSTAKQQGAKSMICLVFLQRRIPNILCTDFIALKPDLADQRYTDRAAGIILLMRKVMSNIGWQK